MALIPPLLAPGDLVLLCAPSFAVGEEKVRALEHYWAHYGLRTQRMPHVLACHHAYAGTDAERQADLQAALDHPEAAAIHCVRGGYGASRILDALDWSAFVHKPKHLIGFSDITLLLQKAVAQGVAAVHGPMGSHLSEPKSAPGQALYDWVCQGKYRLEWQHTNPGTLVKAIQGCVMGGNLTMLAHLLGSGQDIMAGCDILFLEEVGEQHYHVDRMMIQLRRSGMLDGLKAVLLGSFTEMKNTTPPFGAEVYDIVREHVPAHIPVIEGLPAGHQMLNHPIPFGVELVLKQVEDRVRLSRPDLQLG